MTHTINPTQLIHTNNPQVVLSKQLLKLLVEKHFVPYLAAGNYKVMHLGEEVDITLTHSLLKRPKNRDAFFDRFEVLEGNPLIGGGFGRIIKSLGVLIPEDHFRFKVKPENKARICKIIEHRPPFATEQLITQEASYTRLNRLLHAKSAITQQNQSFIVMRYMPEGDLFEFIHGSKNAPARLRSLSLQEKLNLTGLVIQALKTQVHRYNLVHHDIKPENILLDLASKRVIIADYGFAKPIGTKPVTDNNSFPYTAPESLRAHKSATTADIYALGLIIAEMWGDKAINNYDKKKNRMQQFKEFHESYSFKSAFKGIHLSETIKNGLKEIINGFTRYDPAQRMGLDEGLERLNVLIQEASVDNTIANTTTSTAKNNDANTTTITAKNTTANTTTTTIADTSDNSDAITAANTMQNTGTKRKAGELNKSELKKHQGDDNDEDKDSPSIKF